MSTAARKARKRAGVKFEKTTQDARKSNLADYSGRMSVTTEGNHLSVAPVYPQVKNVMEAYNVRGILDYEFRTTAWADLTVAEMVGHLDEGGVMGAVRETMASVEINLTDVVGLTELALVANHMSWQHINTNEPLARYYADAWYRLRDFCYDTFDEAGRRYFFEMTD